MFKNGSNDPSSLRMKTQFEDYPTPLLAEKSIRDKPENKRNCLAHKSTFRSFYGHIKAEGQNFRFGSPPPQRMQSLVVSSSHGHNTRKRRSVEAHGPNPELNQAR